MLGVALADAQRAAIDDADAEALAAWIEHLKAHRALPA